MTAPGIAAAACLLLAIVLGAPAQAQPTSSVEGLDRAVVRWYARATGGPERPQFIMARELAFEARIEALGERTNRPDAPFVDAHVRAAIQRHIAETMLASLPVEPAPTPKDIGRYAEEARRIVEQRVGGREVLFEAANAEGIGPEELNALLRRNARASWYLDRMIAPMLKPTELDLREALDRGESPYTGMRYEDVEEQLKRWYTSTRLAEALDRYFRTVRTRVAVHLIQY